jgi:hypothetical protein
MAIFGEAHKLHAPMFNIIEEPAATATYQQKRQLHIVSPLSRKSHAFSVRSLQWFRIINLHFQESFRSISETSAFRNDLVHCCVVAPAWHNFEFEERRRFLQTKRTKTGLWLGLGT